ncbi:MAG TPA: DUF4038 domain-containing protein [Candidatus Aquilonibacter sp.]|nr:DUF4038 domain-containing protein [Candidatus Aquilonibacter sp.]
MPVANQNRRKTPWLWIVALIGLALVALAGVFIFHYHASIFDQGFSTADALNLAQPPTRDKRPILSAPGQFMTLDPTGRFLINSITGKPVFITGDAASSLIVQLDNSDAELYLSDRASRGFNYVWSLAADNYYQANAPKNYYGDSPFDGPDFTHEDPRYWAHVDYILQRAAVHGITIALSPAFVGVQLPGGYLASYQNTPESVLYAYGEFLGRRYRNLPNIIWAIGGDADPEMGILPQLTALASGIRSEDKVHLMVAEGKGQHSALETFGAVPWLDLNWLYFHETNIPGGAAANYFRSPWLPAFLGEAGYENTTSLSGLQVREQGYWGILSGAYLGNGGFGNSPLWYFRAGPGALPNDPTWQSQLGSAGSICQMYLGRLFRSREHWKLVPDAGHSVLIGGYDSRSLLSSIGESIRSLVRGKPYRLGSASSVAARTSDGQTIIAYVPNGAAATITIAMSAVVDPTSQAKSWWFNPRDGSSRLIGDFATHGTRQFTPPDRDDWVLVIDSLSANLPAPGSTNL